jgi:hypothetical protein
MRIFITFIPNDHTEEDVTGRTVPHMGEKRTLYRLLEG